MEGTGGLFLVLADGAVWGSYGGDGGCLFFCLLFMSPRITSAQEGGSCPSSGLHKTSFFPAIWYFRQKMSPGVRMSLPTNCGHLLANVQINTSESGFMQICKDLVCLTCLFWFCF